MKMRQTTCRYLMVRHQAVNKRQTPTMPLSRLDVALARRDFLRLAGGLGLTLALAPKRALGAMTAGPVVIIDAQTDGTDVTDTILEQIAAAPDWATIKFPEGRYRCEGSLQIGERQGLAFEGPATFYATGPGPLDRWGMSQRRHWWFKDCRDIVVRDLRVESINTEPDQREGFASYVREYEFEHGFAFHACRRVIVEDCSTYGTFGDGLYISNKGSRNIQVSRLLVENNGRQGVSVSRGNNVLLQGIRIANSRRAGFNLEPDISEARVRNVEIRDSFVNSLLIPFSAYGRGDVSNILIRRNRIRHSGAWVFVEAADGTRRQAWRVRNNTVLNWIGTPRAALVFKKVDDIRILGNVSPISPGQSGLAISFDNCKGRLVVKGNDFRKACKLYKKKRSARVIARRNRLSRC